MLTSIFLFMCFSFWFFLGIKLIVISKNDGKFKPNFFEIVLVILYLFSLSVSFVFFVLSTAKLVAETLK